jgi:hypothetical protein
VQTGHGQARDSCSLCKVRLHRLDHVPVRMRSITTGISYKLKIGILLPVCYGPVATGTQRCVRTHRSQLTLGTALIRYMAVHISLWQAIIPCASDQVPPPPEAPS